MDKNLKQEWIKDLRSGEYTQGVHSLRRRGISGVDHCCLGVLVCTMQRLGTEFPDEVSVVMRKFDIEIRVVNSTGEHSSYVSVLPDEVEQAVGLQHQVPNIYVCPNSDGSYPSTIIAGMLMRKNDDGVPFEEIADYIEQNLPEE